MDYLLPIRIHEDWIGVVYRKGIPTQALMDVYDIGNKARLCDPSFDIRTLSMFKNPRFNRLRIIPDLDCGSGSESPPSVRAKSANVRVEHLDCRHRDDNEQYEQRRCVTSLLPSASPTPSPSASPQMDISPAPSTSTVSSWTPKYNETRSNPVRTEMPRNSPVVPQNVVVTSNVANPPIPATSLVPTYPLNADRFDLDVHFLLTYLCLKFSSDFQLTFVNMTPSSQFHGARATVIGSSESVDASSRPGTNYGFCGQYGSDGTNESYGADCGHDGSSGYMPTDAVDE